MHFMTIDVFLQREDVWEHLSESCLTLALSQVAAVTKECLWHCLWPGCDAVVQSLAWLLTCSHFRIFEFWRRSCALLFLTVWACACRAILCDDQCELRQCCKGRPPLREKSEIVFLTLALRNKMKIYLYHSVFLCVEILSLLLNYSCCVNEKCFPHKIIHSW